MVHFYGSQRWRYKGTALYLNKLSSDTRILYVTWILLSVQFCECLQELKDENGRVYKLLSERDFELRQLKKKREEEKAALASKISHKL